MCGFFGLRSAKRIGWVIFSLGVKGKSQEDFEINDLNSYVINSWIRFP